MIRRIRAILVAGLALALLAGCVAIPTSGGVSDYPLRGSEDAPNFNFLARPPVKGADQDEILAGFIQAGIDVQDRYAVARQFLTTDMAATWNPYSSVLVTNGTRNANSRVDENTVSLSVQVSGRVDSAGQYGAESGTRVLSFGFAKERGEWRISSVPGGTVLSPYNFQAIFDPFPLYFLDPSGAFLVPDLRWYPAGASAPDRVVRGLLAGPAAWLGSGAVVSAFPKGTQLGSDGVRIVDGVATVDLSTQVLDESAAARRRMSAQLQATLDPAVATLSGIRLSVRGVAVDVPAGADASTPVAVPQVGPSTIAFGSSGLGAVTAGALRPLDPPAPKVGDLAPGPATLDRSRTTLVLGTAQGVWRVPASGAAVLLDKRGGLVAPSIDPEGFTWTVQSSGIGTVVAFDPRGQTAHAVASSSAIAGAVTGMRISRDGARVVFGVLTGDGPALVVASIQRDSSLVPTGLGPAVTIPVTGGDLVDLAWMDPITIAVVTRDSSGTTVRSQQVGGQSASLGRPTDATQIVGGNDGANGLRVLTADGQLLQQTGAGGWQTTGAPKLSFLVTQQ